MSVGGRRDGIARRGGHEGFYGFHRADASTGAGGGAVEGGGGAGEIELAREGPALQQPIDEACVEDVACTGGVGDGNAIGGTQMEVASIPGENPIFSQGRGGHGAAVAVFHCAKGLFEIALAGETRWEVAADN